MICKSNNSGKNIPIAVTGIGMICPLGITAPKSWENMLQGRSGIRRITKFDACECATRIGGQLPEEYFVLEKKKTSKRMFKQTVQTTRIIRLCSHEAFKDSNIALDKIDPNRCGVIIGTSGSSVRGPHDKGGHGAERFKIIREMINALPAWISLDYGFKGPNFTLSAACASGSYAIAKACDLIKRKELDIAIAGGVDTLLTKNNTMRGNFMKVLSEKNDEPEKAMRPFDRKRDGWVISDGGCAVVLESYEHAIKRNARVYAWVVGHAMSSECYSLYSPVPYGEGMVQTIEMALADANISRQRIGYANANGTSTVVNDFCETMAIKKVFGKHAYNMFVSSQKSMLGHMVGGSSAIEFAITALILKTQKIPPTINYEFPDPKCDLNYVPNKMVDVNDLEVAINNSFGFGGHNCVIVMTR
ncbi:MAG: beta-ketoacyl-[acyl-carrier-protein] synthase family protein [Desulfobacteraceae bacterium]|nr:beta-ketoacyl-[acyl-carrier-protein] synthase family protein [Desulfobacteraceae bacterium]MBC2718601.1 beta-ketoacyl-[acyl-carrier-protein] synthase family protein [Desulfobacteraceae bacterium]